MRIFFHFCRATCELLNSKINTSCVEEGESVAFESNGDSIGVVITLVADCNSEKMSEIAASYGFGFLNYHERLMSQKDEIVRPTLNVKTCLLEIVSWMGFIVKERSPHLQPIGVLASPKRLVQMNAFLPIAPPQGSKNTKYFIPLDISYMREKQMTRCLQDVESLLVKYSDFIENVVWDREDPFIMSQAMQKFLNVYRETSDTTQIDSLDSMRLLLDRNSMCLLMNDIAQAARGKYALPVRSAKWKEVLNPNAHTDVDTLSYPYVLKSRLACGTIDSHHMALILKPEGLGDCELIGPLVAQEYINHNGTLFKVYVIGSKVMTERRTSMPDIQLRGLEDSKLDTLPSCIEFDSLHSLPTRLPWLDKHAANHSRAPSFSILTEHFFEQLAMIVREHVSLSVFGFDIVFDHHAGEVLLLDINYFPSFGSIQDAPTHFINSFLC